MKKFRLLRVCRFTDMVLGFLGIFLVAELRSSSMLGSPHVLNSTICFVDGGEPTMLGGCFGRYQCFICCLVNVSIPLKGSSSKWLLQNNGLSEFSALYWSFFMLVYD